MLQVIHYFFILRDYRLKDGPSWILSKHGLSLDMAWEARESSIGLHQNYIAILPARFARESVRLNERDGLGLLLYFSLIVTILCVNFFNSEGFDAEAVEAWRSGGEGLRDAATESVRFLRKTFTPRPSCRVDFFSINAC